MFHTKSKPEYLALFIFLTIPLLFGMGQEISGVWGPHDNSYFIARALHFDLNGDYHAGIKEILYPLYIRLSWFFGLSLRNFEEICYGIALFCLWLQVIALTNSRFIAWGSVLPLVFFCYQHPIFSGSTYDALQLILLPLSFASSIYMYCSKASWPAVIGAGIVVGLQVLTRAEGVLFILPPVISLIFVCCESENSGNLIGWVRNFIIKVSLILAIVFLNQQIESNINWSYCGFWAPTIMQSRGFERSLKELMEIDPKLPAKIRYAPVPNASLEKAYQISPAFRRAKPYFDKNQKAWTANAIGPYLSFDGSMNGLFQWALLDAGAYVAGGKTDAMLKYFDQVAIELQRGFESGEIKKRWVFSTATGPDFSIFDGNFWFSFWKVGRYFLNLTDPTMPFIAQAGDNPQIVSMYNEAARRRTSLLVTQSLLIGWVVNPVQGIPKFITLDGEAFGNGASLRMIERPDVAKKVCGLGKEKAPHPMCGVEIKSFQHKGGHLLIMDGHYTAALPLDDLMNLKSGGFYKKKSILLCVDSIKNLNSGISPIIIAITKYVYYFAKAIVFLSIFLVVVILLFQKSIMFRSLNFTSVLFVFSLVVSVALPRLILLAALDANMYSAAEIRYVASGDLSIWFFGFFCVCFFIYNLPRMLKNEKFEIV